jgi:predicted methyltransferase
MFKIILLLSSLVMSHFIVASDFTAEGGYQNDLLRETQSKGSDIIALANIKPGMTILDVFGGGGYYSEILSKVVGKQGKVYLHNNKAYMPFIGMELETRLAGGRLKNVVQYDREAENLSLKPNSLDAIFFVLGYHDLYVVNKQWSIDKESFLAQLKSALKLGGKLIVVDHSALEGSEVQYAQQKHRIEKAYVEKELTDKGFTLIQTSDLLVNQEDDRIMSPFDPKIRRKTDRFILIFKK